jgi:hypothetical protein
MSGETDLKRLLGAMQPELVPGIFVFATLPPGRAIPENLAPVMVFHEREGATLILPQDEAVGVGLETTFPCRMITLNVHSSLAAVGFLAAIATRLAGAGMGVNPVSGFFHDHLFVPVACAQEAMAILERLGTESGEQDD